MRRALQQQADDRQGFRPPLRAAHAREEPEAAASEVHGCVQDTHGVPVVRYPPTAVPAGRHEDHVRVQTKSRRGGWFSARRRREEVRAQRGARFRDFEKRVRRGLPDPRVGPGARAPELVHSQCAAGAAAPGSAVCGVRRVHALGRRPDREAHGDRAHEQKPAAPGTKRRPAARHRRVHGTAAVPHHDVHGQHRGGDAEGADPEWPAH
mmetsp:Transcript_7757/g.29011  ORF Transcript_7757/g.29011 Transcript_7757/m.29011 type:complete len:208 (+) Transcript_7757:281-904(+)